MSARRPAPGRRERAAVHGVGGEQVEGRQAVRALLGARRRQVEEVALAEGLEPAPILEEIARLAGAAGVPLRRVPAAALARLAQGEAPQGVVARAAPVPVVELEALAGPGAFLVLLEGVTDPRNLGAVLRSACAAGATGVVLPRRRAAHLTPAALKAAAGAVEHLAFALVPGAGAALQALGRAGVWRVGLDAAAGGELEDVAVLAEPLVLVLGAEGRGLGALSAARCDVLARIPMAGPVESLNVSAAAAVACFTVLRHRRHAPPPGRAG